MNNKTNSAIRLNNIIYNAYTNDSKQIVDVWKNIFKIDEIDKHYIEMSVIECLNILNDEFELLKEKMSETTFSKNLYENEITQLQNLLIVPTGINGDWKPRKEKITNVQFKILDFCSEILPSDEVFVDYEEIEDLKKLLKELEDFIENNSFPNKLNNTIKEHIQKIKMAIYKYDIKGSNVFDEVLKSAYGEVINNPTIFIDESNEEVKNKLSTVWCKVQKIYKTGKNIEQVYIDFSNVSSFMQNILSNTN